MKKIINILKKIKDWYFRTDENLSFKGYICAVGLLSLGIPLALYFIICGIEGKSVSLKYPDFNQWVSLFGSILSFAGTIIMSLLIVYQNKTFHQMNYELQKKLTDIEIKKYIPQIGATYKGDRTINSNKVLDIEISNIGLYSIVDIEIFWSSITVDSLTVFTSNDTLKHEHFYVDHLKINDSYILTLNFENYDYSKNEKFKNNDEFRISFQIICKDIIGTKYHYSYILFMEKTHNDSYSMIKLSKSYK